MSIEQILARGWYFDLDVNLHAIEPMLVDVLGPEHRRNAFVRSCQKNFRACLSTKSIVHDLKAHSKANIVM